MSCLVNGCNKEVDRKGYCSVHYMRQWRNGTTEKIQTRKKRTTHSHGYIVLYKPEHALANSGGYIYEHRFIFYEKHGDGPFECHWCGIDVNWLTLHIDHKDDNKKNNDLGNLVSSCPECNKQRGRWKAVKTWRKKTGIEYNGNVYSMQELSNMRGICRQSMIARLKQMTIEEAMNLPKGKTGPKRKIKL